MAVDGASPRLDALQAPLTSARVLERGTAQREIDHAFARMNGVRLRINPNPRPFVRVVDTGEPSNATAAWQPAVGQALGLLTVRGRAACLALVDEVRAIVAPRVAADPTPDPAS
jgi:hypothetical protein